MLQKNCLRMEHSDKTINKLNSHVPHLTKKVSASVEELTEMSTAGIRGVSLALLSSVMQEKLLPLWLLKE